MRRLLSVFSLSALVAVPPHREDVRCRYTTMEVCRMDGCQPTAVGDRYLLTPELNDLEQSTISDGQRGRLPELRRCDSKGCSPVDVRSAISGIYLAATNEHAGYLIKFARMDEPLSGVKRGDFVEVATLFLSAYVAHGHCSFESR